MGSEFGGRKRRHGRAFDLVGGIVLELTRINGPAAEAGNRGERLGAGARRSLCGLQVGKISLQGRDREQRWMKGCTIGLGGQPGGQVAQRRQVRRDGFIVVAIKGGNEGAERFGIVLPQGKSGHEFSPTSVRDDSPTRFWEQCREYTMP